jgi:hypothetical protein
MTTKSLSDLLHEISQVNHVSSETGVGYYDEIATHFKRRGYERAISALALITLGTALRRSSELNGSKPLSIIARADRMAAWFNQCDRDEKGWYIYQELNDFDVGTSAQVEDEQRPVDSTMLESKVVGVATLVETLEVYQLVVEHCKLTKEDPTEFIALAFLPGEATEASRRALEMFSVVYKYS